MEGKNLILVVVAAVIIIAVGYFYLGTESNIAADQVDIIPDVDVEECLATIRITNPEMSAQEAQDNCYTIEAVNENDESLCNLVSEGFRANCLAQF